MWHITGMVLQPPESLRVHHEVRTCFWVARRQEAEDCGANRCESGGGGRGACAPRARDATPAQATQVRWLTLFYFLTSFRVSLRCLCPDATGNVITILAA